MKKTISAALAALLLLSAFASCSEGNTDNADPQTGSQSAVTPSADIETEPETEDPGLIDNLPEVNYDGYAFRIAHFGGEDVNIEEETGEALNDAIFRRNQAVDERFGVHLEGVEYDDYNKATEAVKAAVTAGTNDFDAAFLHMVSASTAAPGGYFYSIDQLENVDPTKPWWDTDCVDAFTVAGHMKLLCGMPLPNAMLRSSCLAFNKNRFVDYGLEAPYSTVDAGEWTLDAMYELTKDTTSDLDGDGAITEANDFFGLTSWYLDSPYSFYYGAGGKIVTKDADGTPVLNLDLELNTRIYDEIYRVVRENNSNYHTDINTYSMAYDTFLEGRALFCEASLTHFKGEKWREMEDDYGVLPMPKLDTTQEKHMSFVNGAVSMLAVPMTIEDPVRTGILVEGLAVESYRNIRDALFEVTAKSKSARDEDSTRMMDLVMETRVFDLGYSHMYDQSLVNFVRDLLQRDSTDVASTIQKGEKPMAKRLEKIIEAYEKNG